jgi:hypothetical protein
MPHLRYCNRYWYIAGDELSVPALCSISVRIVWTALVIVVTAIASGNLDGCSNGWVLQLFLISSIIIFVLNIICDGFIINASLKGILLFLFFLHCVPFSPHFIGSIIELEKRNKMEYFLTGKVALSLFQVICAAFGLASICLGSSSNCNENSYNYNLSLIFVGIVLASQLLDSSILFCCCYCLQAHNKHSDELHEGVPASLDEDIIQLWEHRCQSFVRYIQIGCCNLFGGNNIEEGFDQVAKVRTLDI